MAIYNTYFSVLGLQDSLGVLPNLGVLPGLGRLDDLGEYAFSPASLFLNGEQGVWYDPSDLTPEKVSWRRNLLTYSQDFENAAWTKSNASILSNLALYSQDFDNAAWAKTNATVTANTSTAPDGTTTADKLIPVVAATDGRVIETVTGGAAGVTYTFSAYGKAVDSGFADFRLFVDDSSANSARVSYNILTGVVTSAATTTGTWTAASSTIADVGNGWYRVTITFTTTGAALTRAMVWCRDAGNGTSGILVWGAQLVPGSTAQTYTRSLATAAPIQFADPLGGTLADKLVENTATSGHRILQSPNGPTGVAYTASVYAKSAERTYLYVEMSDSATGSIAVTVNLSTGVAGAIGTSGAWTNTSVATTAIADGWYRVAFTATRNAGTSTTATFGSSLVGSSSYTGDGVSGIYVYGAQVEQASTASAYQRITDFSSDFLAAFPTHALYQESTGVTPVTALGQSVGYVVDKRLGGMANQGAQLVTNGDFSSGTGWTLGTGWSISDGTAVATGVVSFAQISQNISFSVGRTYRVSASVTVASGTVAIGLGNSGENVWLTTSTSGTYTQFVTINSGTVGTSVYVRGNSAFTGWVDNISVREVPGNHAIQATSAARPTLQARSNLLTYTEQFDNAAWFNPSGTTVAANVATAPDGTQTADRIVNLNAAIGDRTNQSITIQNATLTGSIWLRGEGANIGKDVDLNVKRIGGTFVGTTITHTLTANWVRVSASFTQIAGNTGASFVIGCPASNAATDCLVWGAQYELGSTATTYQRVTTATDYADVGLPRNLTFDGIDDSLATAGNVDFATWTVGTRRNLLTVPTMFDDAAWAVTGLTRTANTIVAPDGTQTGDTITGNSATNAVIFPNAGVSASATNYTFSVYLNLGTASFAVVSLWSGSGTNGVNVWVNGSTGALTGSTNTTAGYTLVSSSSTAMGGGWYRIAVTGTLPAATVYVSVRLVDSDNAFVYTNTSGKTLNLWGAQLEVGSTATAFQDVGTDKVTLFSGVFKPSDDATRVIAELSVDKNSNNGVFFLNTEAAPRWYFESKGTLASSTNSGAVTTFAAPVTSVVTGLGDIGGDASIIRVNGTQLGSNTANQGTGNYGSYVLYIGRRASLSLPFNGRLFQLVIRGAATDSVTVGNAERWVGQLTGVAL